MLRDFDHRPVLSTVWFGRGRTADISGLFADHVEHILVVCGESVSRTPLPDRIAETLGDLHAGTWTGVRPHVPIETVRDGRSIVEETDADALLSLGGGSAIDTAKALSVVALTGDDPETVLEADAIDVGDTLEHVSIPTTLSAAEMTHIVGISDLAAGWKEAVIDEAFYLDGVLYDPEVLSRTPPAVLVATGMNALDHAVEAVYSRLHQPFTDAMALHAIRLLSDHLPASRSGDVDALAMVQLGAALSGREVTNTGVGVNHSVAHVLGARYGVSHGEANGIILPHGLRFNRKESLSRQVLIAEALGVDVDAVTAEEAAGRAANRCAELLEELELPTRLREVDVPHEDLPSIAEEITADFTAGSNPRALTTENVTELLEDAY